MINLGSLHEGGFVELDELGQRNRPASVDERLDRLLDAGADQTADLERAVRLRRDGLEVGAQALEDPVVAGVFGVRVGPGRLEEQLVRDLVVEGGGLGDLPIRVAEKVSRHAAAARFGRVVEAQVIRDLGSLVRAGDARRIRPWMPK